VFDITYVIPENIRDLDGRLTAALAAKTEKLTEVVYTKVRENLSGKILQTKSGQLLGSVQTKTDTAAFPMTGDVFMDPATPKAGALEHGGRGDYPIVATKATVLAYIAEGGAKRFAKRVTHPPSKAFGYLRSVFEEMQTTVADEYRSTIEEVINGS
jgi:hypothetical protein